MTPQEFQAAKKISGLMRSARKRVGLTQVDVSKRLGISQSALSKVENGLLIPSAPQWFEFASITGISADSLVTGFIERCRPAVIESDKTDIGFKVGSRYKRHRGSKVRATLPFLSYFSNVYGEDKLDEYLDSLKIDPDFFIDLDNQINLNFCIDISKRLISDGNMKPKDILRLVKPVGESDTHGSLHHLYDNADSSVNRLRVLLLNSRQYECNFAYAIEDFGRDSVDISIKAEPHLGDFAFKSDNVLGDFLCNYKQRYFERFAAYGDKPGSERSEGVITEKECMYRGGSQCVYQLKVA